MPHVPPVYKVLMLVKNRPAPADARVWPEACALRAHGLQVGIISPIGKVTIVRNAPDARRMRPAKQEPELNMGRRNLFAYVGLMGVQEGLEYAMRALHELEYRCGRHDIAVVLMRDGADAPALHTLAHHLGLDDIICYLTVTDIGLSPVPQNAPNDACTLIKTMVYMVMGKSAVAFDLRETHCSDGEAGLYATPNLVEDFAHTIEVLFDNHELRRTMGHLGRIGVEEELNWKHPTEHLLVAYGTLLSSAHSRHASAASAQVHQEDRSVA